MAIRARADAAPRGQMSLGAHLVELRNRFFTAAVSIVIGIVIGFFVAPGVLGILRAPITAIARSRHASLNYDTVSGAFDLQMQIALFVGIILASPLWLYQIFAYLVPGLTGREKRFTFGFFFTAVPLFAAGCFVGFELFPRIVQVLTSFASPDDSSLLSAQYYFGFVMKLVVAVGVAFVLPVFVVLLNFLGVVSGRAILRGWRVALISITVFCALATPAADVFSMVMLAAPMLALYVAAAVVALGHDVVAERRALRSTDDLLVVGPSAD